MQGRLECTYSEPRRRTLLIRNTVFLVVTLIAGLGAFIVMAGWDASIAAKMVMAFIILALGTLTFVPVLRDMQAAYYRQTILRIDAEGVRFGRRNIPWSWVERAVLGNTAGPDERFLSLTIRDMDPLFLKIVRGVWILTGGVDFRNHHISLSNPHYTSDVTEMAGMVEQYREVDKWL